MKASNSTVPTFSGGSLSEIFYGLTRTRTTTDQFHRLDKIVTFLIVVILPYLQAKLDTFRQKFKDEMENANPIQQKTKELRRKRLAIHLITYSKALHDGLQLFQLISYMSGISKSHSVVNRLARQQLNYLPPDAQVTWTWTDLFTGKFKSTAILSGVIFRSLELSAFFLQFLQWWQNEANFTSITNLPTPSAPMDSMGLSRYKGICPICMQQWQIPTVNRISG